MKLTTLLLLLLLSLTACNPASSPEPTVENHPAAQENQTKIIKTTTKPLPSPTVLPTATATPDVIEETPDEEAEAAPDTDPEAETEAEDTPLERVEQWSYLIEEPLSPEQIEAIAASDVDLVVLDFTPAAVNQTDYDIAETVGRLRNADTPKLVLAYLNIGQVEPSRAYWPAAWDEERPWWVIEPETALPHGNLPVSYWNEAYRAIWLAEEGLIPAVVEAGFDGLYLDGIEAYADPLVADFAEEDGSDPAQEMVWLVGDIAALAREQQPAFIIIGHNAVELVEWDEENYLRSTLDGLAQERLWFDDLSDSDLSEAQLPLLKAAQETGHKILTVDYPLAEADAEWVIEESRSLGFTPLVGETLLGRYRTAEEALPGELAALEEATIADTPTPPPPPTPTPKPTPLPPEFAAVESFLYQLQDIDLEAVGQTGYDLVIMDYAAEGIDDTAFSAAQIEALKNSPGGSKIAISYMSIGEAETYRFYWDPAWDADGDGQPDDAAPAWLDIENPYWEGNYKVRYWEPSWQAIIFGYTDKLIEAGFDGAYLDIIDAFTYYEDQGRESAAQEMADFVAAIAAHARHRDPDFYIFPQNGADLAAKVPAYLDSVSGIGQEDVYYGYEADDQATPPEATARLEGHLDRFLYAGKLVLTTDYATTPAHIDDAYAKSRAKGYVPFVTVRDLGTLTINAGYEPK